jgi:hypothetical protein
MKNDASRWTRYQAVKSYESPYEDGVEFGKGERLRYERRESDWPGWLWCTSRAGSEAWVPEPGVTLDGENCVLVRDYAARELSLKLGDVVRTRLEESGWVWAAAASGREGWVPLACLEKQ